MFPPTADSLVEKIDTRLPSLPIHYLRTSRTRPKSIVVLFPSALNPNRGNRNRRIFVRSTWAKEWPHAEVICFSDPALDLDSRLNGAWFIHPSVDIIRVLADIIRDIASEHSIAEENMVFYGSSLGGFGALMAAACFSEVHAVAEVPQLDFRLWQRRAVLDVEKYLLNGADISAFTKNIQSGSPYSIDSSRRTEYRSLRSLQTAQTSGYASSGFS